jgi:hypothetical protein
MSTGAVGGGPASVVPESPVVRLAPLGLMVGIASLVEVAGASVRGAHTFGDDDLLTTIAFEGASLLGGLAAWFVGARRTVALAGLLVVVASASGALLPASVAGWVRAIGDAAFYPALFAAAREVARTREAAAGAFLAVTFGFSAGWAVAATADLHHFAWPLLAVGCLLMLRAPRHPEAQSSDAGTRPFRDAFVLALLSLPALLLRRSALPAWATMNYSTDIVGMARAAEMAGFLLTGAAAVAFVALARRGGRLPLWHLLGAASIFAGVFGSAGLLQGVWARAGALTSLGGQQLGIAVLGAIGLVLLCDAGGPRTRTIRLAAWLLATRLLANRLSRLTGDVLDTQREAFALDCVLCVLAGAMAFVPQFVRRTRRRMDAARAMVGEDDPRFGAERTSGQVAGTTCVDCERRIVLESSGVRCPTCGAAVHRQGCARHHEALVHPPVAPEAYR